MRLFFLLITFITFGNVSAAANGKRVYINKEGLKVAPVFSNYGFDSETCAQNPSQCKAIAWPNRTAEVIDLGERVKVWRKNPYTNEDEQVEYARVQVSYIRIADNGYLNDVNGRVGFIESAYLSDEPVRSLYAVDPPAKKYCPPKKGDTNTANPQVKEQTAPIADVVLAAENEQISTVNAAASKLQRQVGDCINPAGKKEAAITYDGFIYDHMMSKPVPKVIGESGKPMTQQQYMDIDSLSRTLYAEMAKCYKYGLQYPMAVAKISYNRAYTDIKSRQDEFMFGSHRPKGNMGRALTSTYQYSAWNKRHKNKEGQMIENPSLKQALCPPQDPKKKYWKKNELPNPDEQEIWEETVKIATEAVLFPKNFAKRTQDVKGYFYTSGMDRDDMRRMKAPVIEGRAVSNPSCTKFWTDGKR